MHSLPPTPTDRTPIQFPEWKSVLATTNWPAPDQQRVSRAVLSLLRHCKSRHCPVCATVIREYLAAIPARPAREDAREALAWFYTRGRHQPARAASSAGDTPPAEPPPTLGRARTRRPDHPPDTRDDLGGADWERDLIRAVREQHLKWRTERTYRNWAARFVRALAGRSPYAADGDDVARFLSDLAVVEGASPATQKQALNALVFFLQDALHRHVGEIEFRRPRRRVKLPVVLSLGECERLFAQLDGTRRLMAELAYGAGLRLMELLRLRVHHLDFARGQIQVHG